MNAEKTADGSEWVASMLRGIGPEWERCEAELDAAGHPQPLPHRAVWVNALVGPDSRFLAVRDRAGICRGGFAVEVGRSRALPGHVLWRVRRYIPLTEAAATGVAFTELAKHARRHTRVLRVNVELFSPEPAVRAAAGATLAALGFMPAREPRSYRETITIDLTPPEDALFAGLSKSTRREIRMPGKAGMEIRPITDHLLAPRLEVLRRATVGRTGGLFTPRVWGPVIRFCEQHPELARLVGLFRPNVNGPDALLAYAWGRHHTDHGEYYDAASIRADDIKVPLMYGLIWDLMTWAKRQRARWFDMGGVTSGQAGDALAGISAFKRSFGKTEVQVGEEWEWEPHPTRARLSQAMSALARRFTRRKSG